MVGVAEAAVVVEMVEMVVVLEGEEAAVGEAEAVKPPCQTHLKARSDA